MLPKVFHVIMVIHYTFMIYYGQYILSPPDHIRKLDAIGFGSLKFITYWDILVQWLYFTLAVLNDIRFPSNASLSVQRSSQLTKWRDFIFTTIGFSMAVFVCTAFWGLYAIDRELIQPAAEFDSWFPTWFNQGIHTVPIFGVLVEMQLTYHRFPSSRVFGFLTVAGFASAYLLWTLFIGFYWDFWVYAILQHLSGIERFGFITVMAVFFALTYFVGEALHHQTWKVKIA